MLKNLVYPAMFLMIPLAMSSCAKNPGDSGLNNAPYQEGHVPEAPIGLAKNVTTGPPIRFGEAVTGKISQYHEQPLGSFRQDLSGAATNGTHTIFVDDGGSPADFNFVRVMEDLLDPQQAEFADNLAVNLPLTLSHKDLEGATFHQGYFIATGSLSSQTDVDVRRLTRFQVNTDGTQLVAEESVDLHDALRDALEGYFGEEWYQRIKDQPGRDGGLNIEGISAPQTGQDLLLWGLRSPLFSDTFATTDESGELILDEGAAIIAEVYNPFDPNPTFDFQTVHLATEAGDQGIRGMEWIPMLHGYVIISGPIPRGNDYFLWRLRPNGDLDPIELEGFESLCRPESVIQVTENGKEYLVVLSEESGSDCTDVPFTFVKAEILP